MKPTFVRLQALATLLASLLMLGILGEPAAAALLALAVVGVAIWAWFGWRYRRLRQVSELPPSDLRQQANGVMRQSFVLGLLTPSVLTLAMLLLSGSVGLPAPPVQEGLAVIVALCVVAIPLSMLVSSSVDWYLIRAFREGVWGDPVCRRHPAGSKSDYGRYWVMHRLVCEFVVYLAVSGVVGLCTALAMANTSSKLGSSVLAVVGISGFLGWTMTEMAKLRPALDFVRFPPGAGLGDWAEGHTDADGDLIEGFVLDLSVAPGAQLMEEPRGHPCEDVSDPNRSVPLRKRRTFKRKDPPRELCPGGQCEFWVPDCEVGLRRRDEQARVKDAERAGQAVAG